MSGYAANPTLVGSDLGVAVKRDPIAFGMENRKDNALNNTF